MLDWSYIYSDSYGSLYYYALFFFLNAFSLVYYLDGKVIHIASLINKNIKQAYDAGVSSKGGLKMITELFYTDEMQVTINHNGVVLKEYDDVRNGYNFKIIADIAVVNDSNGLHVYGSSEGEEELYTNINELVGFTDKAIEIHIIDEEVNSYHLPEGETVISPRITESGDFVFWALVLYKPNPVLYVRLDAFNEFQYGDVTSVLSKLHFL